MDSEFRKKFNDNFEKSKEDCIDNIIAMCAMSCVGDFQSNIRSFIHYDKNKKDNKNPEKRVYETRNREKHITDPKERQMAINMLILGSLFSNENFSFYVVERATKNEKDWKKSKVIKSRSSNSCAVAGTDYLLDPSVYMSRRPLCAKNAGCRTNQSKRNGLIFFH
ncbi:Oidioi.mRNA.OKI2018_I69.PAR.g13110.t1.cds [Oikopleura dioica]|uniref:Oidioi.mRNA.OKI2018_I69.PAR.g13110.t1.cds n=1 Tax=Oikopleura dioica TaxID=34765 RepID=A0ABN7S369_OIKDI|nr:Oidioi.mRNA.OKI2018_I69.PAR.g13110.t1.cds [Oikopleura dioica]